MVDQMAAQPHIPYAILPKRFEPKQVAGNGLQQQSRSSNNNNNNSHNLGGGNRRRRQAAPRRSQRQQEFYDDQWEDDEDDDLWLEPTHPMMMMNRRFARRPNRNFNAPPAFYGPRVSTKSPLPSLDSHDRVLSSSAWTTTTIHTPTDLCHDKDPCHFVPAVV